MSKYNKKLNLLLIFVLLFFSTAQLTNANMIETNSTDEIKIGHKTPLTTEEIEAFWPNLPTAQELYKEGCTVIDLRYCGKQASSINNNFPDQNSSTVINVKSMIVNSTVDLPDYLHSRIIQDYPKIWLQYNSSIWVSVPFKYLKTATKPT